MGETLTMRQVGNLVRSGRLRFEPYATERDGVPVTGTAVVLMDSGRERDAEWREPCCPRCRAISDSDLLMLKSLREVKHIGPYTMHADGVVMCSASGEVVPFVPTPQERRVFQALVACYPLPVSYGALCHALGFAAEERHHLRVNTARLRARMAQTLGGVRVETAVGYGYGLVVATEMWRQT